MKLAIKKYNQEGDMANEYRPLHNIQKYSINEDEWKIDDFVTDEISVDLRHPLNIECQPSYDGTVNLILNDDLNPPRIINSRFSVLEDNRYKVINRNQLTQTNLYQEGKVDAQTRLFRNIGSIPRINLSKVGTHGKLRCGNYTFYIKLADNDYNQTDVVAESGSVSVVKGDFTNIPSITGGLLDEISDKTITLSISNLDTSFSQLYLYYVRDTSDINGFRVTKAAQLSQSYPIKSNTMSITITGYEDIQEIDYESLNIQYNLITAAKTQTQVQNMLFFGNIQDTNINIKDLQNISLYLPVSLEQTEKSIGWVTEDYKAKNTDNVNQVEYYNPLNTYYYLGYWPGEIYRLGIVYIMNDDSLSPVFNLRGCKFNDLGESNIPFDLSEENKNLFLSKDGSIKDWEMNYIPTDEYLSYSWLANTKGVFKIPDQNEKLKIHDYNKKEIKPLYFKITISDEIKTFLKVKYNVKGYFIVRQKRIPITIAQGLSIGVDKISHVPMLKTVVKDDDIYDNSEKYICEGFVSKTGTLTTDYESRIKQTESKQSSGILCLDACVNPLIQSNLDGSQFIFQPINAKANGTLIQQKYKSRSYYLEQSASENELYEIEPTKSKAVFVNTDIPLVYIDNFGFSTRAGNSEEAKQFAFFGSKKYDKSNTNLIRGVFTPFIGLTESLEDNLIYNIRSQDYSVAIEKEYFSIRGNDNSPYYAISDRWEITNPINELSVYRGDCYSCTITFRMQRNFVDSSVPTNELIVDPDTWSKVYNGYNQTDVEKWADINLADLNTVPIGTWVTFKVLSNYNLGLRSLDRSHVDETAIMGNPRSFYPHSDISTSASYKMNESWILNDGYSSTVGVRRNFIYPNVPYIKDVYDTRVMFSNVQVEDDFKNAYRIFQGLSYKDIDRQYGAIVKLIDWGTNLFCVFEHGLAILPINEKALIQSQTGQSIHMYGAGVLQNQVSLISSDFGSIWQDSIIKTPTGIYGVDTYNKKIWKYSNENKLEIISDTKVQSYLNENIKLLEKDKYPILGLKNVKTHYNNYKGDVMFTFYNNDVVWNLCYNERLNKWITRYSWTPLLSENIDSSFCSMDKKRTELFAHIFNNQFLEIGLKVDGDEWKQTDSHNLTLTPVGFDDVFDYQYQITSPITSSYVDNNSNEHIIELDPNQISINVVDKVANLTLNPSLLSYDGQNLIYWKFEIKYTPIYNEIPSNPLYQTIVVIKEYESLSASDKEQYDKLLRNGIYIHGRSGVFDEIDYNDDNPDNQIKPTNWYDKQEPFEFEFVVNNLIGAHKIFDNLVIISNKVQPKELEFEIIGDVYNFNKAGIYKFKQFGKDEFENLDKSQEFKNVEVVYDNVTNKYNLRINQECKDITDFGRMRGNIHYKEDSWYVVIEPIKYCKITKSGEKSDIASTRIRDKFLKIRVKYSGEDLAIISSLKTLMTLSYA